VRAQLILHGGGNEVAAGVAEEGGALLGFVAAYAACYMVHEWGHYLGARAAGAHLPLGPYRGVLLGLFDTRAHTRRQFQMMSLGGISGYVLTALCCLGAFTALGGGAAAGGLLAGGAAFVVQSLSVDLPIVWRVQRGADVTPTAAQGATARIILRRTAVSWLLLLLVALIWWST